MRAARRRTRKQRRDTERAGLVASSSAQRLKPRAIDIRVNIDPVHWFLSPAKASRSSLYLEDAATELQVLGLKLDWTKSHVGRRLMLVGRRILHPWYPRAILLKGAGYLVMSPHFARAVAAGSQRSLHYQYVSAARNDHDA
jgi:hypothetical protein